MIRIVMLVAALMMAAPITAVAAEVGVVLLHAKWGTAKKKSPVGKLVSKLESAGFSVEAPDMPWHRDRYLDKGHEESMAEIDKAVERLKDRGATKIVVAGHSMGANAAIGYGARRDGLAGIMAIAPGHVPDIQADTFAGDIARARAMMAAGNGDETDDFHDINQGEPKAIRASAEDYLSWFDPTGPAAMPLTTPKLRTSLLWIIGEQDRMNDRGESYAFAGAPDQGHNQYTVIGGGHKATPYKGAKQIIAWLKRL